MAVKRKRSADHSPLSISSYTASTPEAQSPTPVPDQFDGAMDLETTFQFNPVTAWNMRTRRVSSSDLGSRTRKRFRDNRPDQRAIHENTLQKLFSAQRNFPHASPVPSHSESPVQHHETPVQKSTLHSFWKLPGPPSASSFTPLQPPSLAQSNIPRCEDCDAVLQAETDGMEMDLDESETGNQFACQDCGRKVCGTCVVVAETRNCLQCATTSRNSRPGW
jgi:hypothetical protein